MNDKQTGQHGGASEQSREESGRLKLRTVDLFKDGRSVLIEHHGEIYQLRITRSGKLILNK